MVNGAGTDVFMTLVETFTLTSFALMGKKTSETEEKRHRSKIGSLF